MDESFLTERRTLSRLPGNTLSPLRLREGRKKDEILARVENISIGGLGMLTQECLEPGMWLVLEPQGEKRPLTPELKVEVIHSRRYDNEQYVAGCRFSRHLTAEDMEKLG